MENKLKIFTVPFVLIYDLFTRLRNLLYETSILRVKKVNSTIISVGNISVGGSGKTPLTMWIAEYLLNDGKTTAVLSRGYKRHSKGFVLVSDGRDIKTDVVTAGDEPFLMAAKMKGIPVAVCENRVAGAEKLIEMFSPDIIVLDDAFQHRRIHRDLNVLIINERDIETGMKIFPVGTLRESKNALKRAGLILLNGDIPDPGIKYDGNFRLKYSSVRDMNNIVVDPGNKNFIAFCGLANNRSFFRLLNLNGIKVIKTVEYRDHYFYKMEDYEYLNVKMEELKADAFITTEKDFVKLDKEFTGNNNVFFLTVEIDFLSDAENFKNTLKTLKKRGVE
ncbi:tetraacyldisaccharide 4'-kinase [candidate division KSB1 bacterium]